MLLFQVFQESSDVKLVVEGHPLYAHDVVLSARSPVLRDLLAREQDERGYVSN
jgi:hypothetical protein